MARAIGASEAAGLHEGTIVAGPGQHQRARAQDDQALRRDRAGQPAEAGSEAPAVPFFDHGDPGGAGRAERRGVAGGQRATRGVERRLERAGVRAQRRVEDQDGHVGHARILGA